MAVDYSGLRSLTARELIAALDRDGFSFVRQSGSHERYRHPAGDSVAARKSMIEAQVCWTEEDLKRLKLR
jgi:Holliday junction resolvase